MILDLGKRARRQNQEHVGPVGAKYASAVGISLYSGSVSVQNMCRGAGILSSTQGIWDGKTPGHPDDGQAMGYTNSCYITPEQRQPAVAGDTNF
jgi:hypothetical protein